VVGDQLKLSCEQYGLEDTLLSLKDTSARRLLRISLHGPRSASFKRHGLLLFVAHGRRFELPTRLKEEDRGKGCHLDEFGA
jgi:hypothetical protein